MSAMTGDARREELGSLGYELFIVGLSLISLVNFAIAFLPVDSQVKVIASFVDIPISLVLLIDFARRLLRSQPRRAYFIDNGGWLDLLGSLPFSQLKIFRLFRVMRVSRLLRRYGGREILRSVIRHRADNALRIIVFLVLILLEFGSMSVLAAERSSPDANIKTGGEAVWWAFVSITTVGYGDYYPTSTWGRLFAVFILAAGVGLFGALSGFLANFFLTPAKEDVGSDGTALSNDPIRMLTELEARFTAELAAIREAMAASANDVSPSANSDTDTDVD